MAKVLLVEPFYGGSHAAWADGLVRHSRHEITMVTHPATAWRWRMRGGALTLAEDTRCAVELHGPPDVVLVSGMIDLAGWLGLTRRFLGNALVVLYLHENQLVYPVSPNQSGTPTREFPFVNWMGMAAADEVWCNSDYHREVLLGALPDLLSRVPDQPHIELLPAVADQCYVVPVGVDLADIPSAQRTGGVPADGGDGPLVLWNQRWDHDKNPRAVFRALSRLADEDVLFRVALAGQNERVDPQEFDELRCRLRDRVVAFGLLERPDYVDLLGRSDIVVSAAHHEFFGIAVTEAIAAGCVPVLPDRLSYPGLVGSWSKAALYPDGDLTDRLRAVLTNLSDWRCLVAGLEMDIRRFDWRTVIDLYDDRFEVLASIAGTGRN